MYSLSKRFYPKRHTSSNILSFWFNTPCLQVGIKLKQGKMNNINNISLIHNTKLESIQFISNIEVQTKFNLISHISTLF